nr:hypothetical protein [Tanacetum cinerariifolium]
MIGRNNDIVKCVMIHVTDQAAVCLVEVKSTNEKLYCCFIHAENEGRLRRRLWSDLINFKAMTNNIPMVLMGDLNSLLNASSSVLEKIDKVMVNEDFMDVYTKAHVVFLPYGISDHSHAVLTCSQHIRTKPKSFRVEEICGEDNTRYSSDQILIKFVNHFQKFLGVQKGKECLALDCNLFISKINIQVALKMVDEVTNDEIKDAVVDIEDNKAPGPYGFTAKFFKKAWQIVGTNVCCAIKELFAKGKLLWELNATLITLVPNITTPNKVSDFRPIACCNVKAYDIVDWRFLEYTLRLLRFQLIMVTWIMACVSTSSYTICINSDRHGFFKGGRGLRHGDPMSPYLFTLVMEVFNLILQQKIREDPSFKYHFRCKSLKITHLSFADDLLVPCHRDVNSAKVYWASIFKLPKMVIKDIERLFKGFLWNRGELQRGKAMVSWKDVYQPKQNGGLDTFVSRRDIYVARFSNGKIVADCIFKNKWKWPEEWYSKYPILDQYTVVILNNEIKEKLMWISNNGSEKKFASNHVWKDLRILNENVQWWKLGLGRDMVRYVGAMRGLISGGCTIRKGFPLGRVKGLDGQ